MIMPQSDHSIENNAKSKNKNKRVILGPTLDSVENTPKRKKSNRKRGRRKKSSSGDPQDVIREKDIEIKMLQNKIDRLLKERKKSSKFLTKALSASVCRVQEIEKNYAEAEALLLSENKDQEEYITELQKNVLIIKEEPQEELDDDVERLRKENEALKEELRKKEETEKSLNEALEASRLKAESNQSQFDIAKIAWLAEKDVLTATLEGYRRLNTEKDVLLLEKTQAWKQDLRDELDKLRASRGRARQLSSQDPCEQSDKPEVSQKSDKSQEMDKGTIIVPQLTIDKRKEKISNYPTKLNNTEEKKTNVSDANDHKEEIEVKIVKNTESYDLVKKKRNKRGNAVCSISSVG